MSQLAKSIEADDQPNLSAEIEKDLERLKWNLLHGNVPKALQIAEDLQFALDLEENRQEQRKLLKAVREFGTYITANRPFIPNYGDRYRHGETISTAFVESAINQVLSKRFVKKQQMRWTDRGAHLLLQVQDPRFERGLALHAVALVPRNGRNMRCEGGVAPGFSRSPYCNGGGLRSGRQEFSVASLAHTAVSIATFLRLSLSMAWSPGSDLRVAKRLRPNWTKIRAVIERLFERPNFRPGGHAHTIRKTLWISVLT